MAVNTIPNPNPEVITIPLSINTGVATGSGSLEVCGRVATLSVNIRPGITGANLLLAALPDAYKQQYAPSTNRWLSCIYYTGSGQMAEAEMTSDGNLFISTPAKDVDLKISGTWITKE